MPTRVKICGITRFEDAELAIELGASALGFNFYPRSPRYLTPANANSIIVRLPPFVVAVGVFANENDGAHMAEVAREAGAAAIQIHGPALPLPSLASGVLNGFRVIQAIAVSKEFKPQVLQKLKADAFLLDGFDAALPGGTGRIFDWSLAREAKQYGPIILAGGLTAGNVGRAIREARPFAVDVAGGVESEPGKKDPEKLRAFFAAAAKADPSNSE